MKELGNVGCSRWSVVVSFVVSIRQGDLTLRLRSLFSPFLFSFLNFSSSIQVAIAVLLLCELRFLWD